MASFLSVFAGESGDDGSFRCSTTELHGEKPWQELNLRPSKEPPHITTGETRHSLALQVAHVTKHSKSRDDLNVVLNQNETVIQVAVGE